MDSLHKQFSKMQKQLVKLTKSIARQPYATVIQHPNRSLSSRPTSTRPIRRKIQPDYIRWKTSIRRRLSSTSPRGKRSKTMEEVEDTRYTLCVARPSSTSSSVSYCPPVPPSLSICFVHMSNEGSCRTLGFGNFPVSFIYVPRLSRLSARVTTSSAPQDRFDLFTRVTIALLDCLRPLRSHPTHIPGVARLFHLFSHVTPVV